MFSQRSTTTILTYPQLVHFEPDRTELHNDDWRQYVFESPWSRGTLLRLITDFDFIAETVFINWIHKLAEQVPLGKSFRIGGRNIPVDHTAEDAVWNCDHADNNYYYDYGYCVVTTTINIYATAAFAHRK